MLARGLHRIHPSFRIVALAEPPVIGAVQGQWLTPEALTLFLYHNMRRLSSQETIDLVQRLVSHAGTFFLFVFCLCLSQFIPKNLLSALHVIIVKDPQQDL